ncbi:glycosyltransferase [Vulgatibacter incomptus]|uniref:Glycosyltransferase n=1 Tax=Vulgatibacter incomptus TaxID=1391653 RepID=A0A0K1PAU9_9BACT|nr:glycosyltransferase [Vulgatibacter incomptus]AKU90668.1 Glycosyltransferase [Vulgatibacter incomptus]
MIHSHHLDASAALRGRDIVCFSNDWDGDPLSKTHIMKALARDNRILWVNSVANRRPTASAQDLGRIAKKLADAARGVTEPWPNLHVLGPLAVPSFGPLARKMNGSVFRKQVLRAMKRLDFKRPISWSFLPASASVSGNLGEDLVIYHCVDEFSAFAGAAPEIAELEATLARRADLVIVSAERLRQAKISLNPNCHLVRHGVDHVHFSQALSPLTRLPADLEGLPHPVIGFFGLLAEWVDLPLVRAVADAFPHGSVVLLGKVQTSLAPLAGARNVHLMGRRPYEELPCWCKGFDVALMPFVDSELAASSNPLKVREYLAAGLPVVSTPVPEVEKLGLCRIAKGPAAFVEAVHSALADPGPNATRSAAVAAESWDARVEELRSLVAATTSRR